MEELLRTKLDAIFADYERNDDTSELYDEVLSNLKAAADEAVKSGATEEDAVHQAFTEMGDLTEVLEEITIKKSASSVLTAMPAASLTSLPLANETFFELSALTEIVLDFQSMNLDVLGTDSSQICLQEYMNIDNPEFFAQVERSENRLTIRNGKRPTLFGIPRPVRRRAVLFIPRAFAGLVKTEIKSGNLSVKDLKLAQLLLTCQSGNLKANELEVGQLLVALGSGNGKFGTVMTDSCTIQARSGNLDFNKFTADSAEISAKSGNVALSDARFTEAKIELKSGNLKLKNSMALAAELFVKSGNINAEILKFKNLHARSTSGNVKVWVAKDTAFEFQLKSGSGNTKIDHVKATYDVKTQSYKSGKVVSADSAIEAKLSAETSSGNVSVRSL